MNVAVAILEIKRYRYIHLHVNSLYINQAAHQDRAYPGFCSLKHLGVFLLLHGGDASLLVHCGGTPSTKFPAPIHTLGWREALGGGGGNCPA